MTESLTYKIKPILDARGNHDYDMLRLKVKSGGLTFKFTPAFPKAAWGLLYKACISKDYFMQTWPVKQGVCLIQVLQNGQVTFALDCFGAGSISVDLPIEACVEVFKKLSHESFKE